MASEGFRDYNLLERLHKMRIHTYNHTYIHICNFYACIHIYLDLHRGRVLGQRGTIPPKVEVYGGKSRSYPQRSHPFMTSTRRGSGSCGRMWLGRGQAPCGRPDRKLILESTDVIHSCLLLMQRSWRLFYGIKSGKFSAI